MRFVQTMMHGTVPNNPAEPSSRRAWGALLPTLIAFVLMALPPNYGAIADDRPDDFDEHWMRDRLVHATARPSPPPFPDPPVTRENLDDWLLAMDIDRPTAEAIRQLHRAMTTEYETIWMRTMERHRDGKHAVDPPHEALPMRRDADDTELNRFTRASQAWKERFLEDLELLLPSEQARTLERIRRIMWRQELMPYALFDHQSAPLLSDVLAETITQMEPAAREPLERLIHAYHAALDPHLESVDRLHQEIGAHIPEYTRLIGMLGPALGRHIEAAGLTPEEFHESIRRINVRFNALTVELIHTYREIHRVNEQYAHLLSEISPEGARAKIHNAIKPIPAINADEHGPLRELLVEGRFVPALILLGGHTPLLDLDPRARPEIAERNEINPGYAASWLEPRRPVPPLTEAQRQLLAPLIDWHAEQIRDMLGIDASADMPAVPRHGRRRQTNLLIPEGAFMMTNIAPPQRPGSDGPHQAGLAESEASERRLIEIEAEAMRRLRESLTLEQRMAVARF